MTDNEIIKYANEHLWYLREGDFHPAPLRDMNGGKGVRTVKFLDEMRQCGAVYPTFAVAAGVSKKVRFLLGQASLECLVSTNTPQDKG